MNEQDSTQVTFTQVYEDFKDALSGAADALKTGSEHVYNVLVTQQIVNSWTWLITGVVAGVIIYIGARIYKTVQWEYSEPKDGHTVTLILSVCFFAVGGLTGIAALLNIDVIVTGFVNPEYGAIQEIRKFIR